MSDWIIGKLAPLVISILALLVSGVSLWLGINAQKLREVPPEVFANLHRFEFTPTSNATWDVIHESSGTRLVEVSGNAVVSVSNRSTEPAQILSCVIATRDVHTGAGGLGERQNSCVFEDSFSLPVSIAPGQTIFFEVSYSDHLASFDLEPALKKMGIDKLALLRGMKKNGACLLNRSVSQKRGGMNQNCSISEYHGSPSQIAGYLILQTGRKDTVRTPLSISFDQMWPWVDRTP